MAARLRLLRAALDLTQAQMGRMAGVSQQAWQNWEAGIRQPEVVNIWTLNASIGTTIEWILEGRASDLPVRLTEQLRLAEREMERKAKLRRS